LVILNFQDFPATLYIPPSVNEILDQYRDGTIELIDIPPHVMTLAYVPAHLQWAERQPHKFDDPHMLRMAQFLSPTYPDSPVPSASSDCSHILEMPAEIGTPGMSERSRTLNSRQKYPYRIFFIRRGDNLVCCSCKVENLRRVVEERSITTVNEYGHLIVKCATPVFSSIIETSRRAPYISLLNIQDDILDIKINGPMVNSGRMKYMAMYINNSCDQIKNVIYPNGSMRHRYTENGHLDDGHRFMRFGTTQTLISVLKAMGPDDVEYDYVRTGVLDPKYHPHQKHFKKVGRFFNTISPLTGRLRLNTSQYTTPDQMYEAMLRYSPSDDFSGSQVLPVHSPTDLYELD